jgi:FMN phosphatase YigB (HAD superfamily)
VDDKEQHLLAAEAMGMRGVLYVSAPQVIRDIQGALTDD